MIHQICLRYVKLTFKQLNIDSPVIEFIAIYISIAFGVYVVSKWFNPFVNRLRFKNEKANSI